MNFLNCSIDKIKLLNAVQVLAIDNDRDALYLYTVLLEEYGANTVTAGSIKEALKVFGWLLPDILISEMRFYGESIDTLIAKLSEMENISGNHIPAIATTWITDSFAQTLDTNFEDYLLKPVDLDILIPMVESLLHGRCNYSVGIKPAKELSSSRENLALSH